MKMIEKRVHQQLVVGSVVVEGDYSTGVVIVAAERERFSKT